MKSVLITGGLGLIGSTLAERLSAAGHDVRIVDCLDARAGGDAYNVSPALREVSIIASIDDPSIWQRLPGHIDVVVNLAGLSGHSYSMNHPAEDLQGNVVVQAAFLQHLLERASPQMVILASTRQVYGVRPGEQRDVSKPADVNAVGRLAVEQLHEVMLRSTGTALTILRLSNIYGGAMLRSATPQGVLGTWLRAAARGEDIVVTTPSPVRDPLHVEDLADLLITIIDSSTVNDPGPEILDVGSGEGVSLSDIAAHLGAFSGSRVLRRSIHPTDQRFAVDDYVSDVSQAAEQYSWRPSRQWQEEMPRIVGAAAPTRDGGER